jgi:hypothetical protein
MQQPQTHTSSTPSTVNTTPVTGPVEIDVRLLALVSGAGPNGGWSTLCGPNGGWR